MSDFGKKPPSDTGDDDFNLDWLNNTDDSSDSDERLFGFDDDEPENIHGDRDRDTGVGQSQFGKLASRRMEDVMKKAEDADFGDTDELLDWMAEPETEETDMPEWLRGMPVPPDTDENPQWESTVDNLVDSAQGSTAIARQEIGDDEAWLKMAGFDFENDTAETDNPAWMASTGLTDKLNDPNHENPEWVAKTGLTDKLNNPADENPEWVAKTGITDSLEQADNTASDWLAKAGFDELADLASQFKDEESDSDFESTPYGDFKFVPLQSKAPDDLTSNDFDPDDFDQNEFEFDPLQSNDLGGLDDFNAEEFEFSPLQDNPLDAIPEFNPDVFEFPALQSSDLDGVDEFSLEDFDMDINDDDMDALFADPIRSSAPIEDDISWQNDFPDFDSIDKPVTDELPSWLQEMPIDDGISFDDAFADLFGADEKSDEPKIRTDELPYFSAEPQRLEGTGNAPDWLGRLSTDELSAITPISSDDEAFLSSRPLAGSTRFEAQQAPEDPDDIDAIFANLKPDVPATAKASLQNTDFESLFGDALTDDNEFRMLAENAMDAEDTSVPDFNALFGDDDDEPVVGNEVPNFFDDPAFDTSSRKPAVAPPVQNDLSNLFDDDMFDTTGIAEFDDNPYELPSTDELATNNFLDTYDRQDEDNAFDFTTHQEDGDNLAQADLPEWLRDSQKPVSSGESLGAILRQREDRSLEDLDDRLLALRQDGMNLPVEDTQKTGLISEILPGIPEVLAPASFSAEAVAPLLSTTVLTSEQTKRATLLKTLVQGETGASRTASRRRRNIPFAQIAIGLVLFAVVLAPFFVDNLRVGRQPVAFFEANSRQAAAFIALDALQTGQYVLVGIEYGASSANELDDLTATLFRHIGSRGGIPVIISSNAIGLLRAQDILEDVFPNGANSQYFVTRYLSAGSLSLRDFVNNPQPSLENDTTGQPNNLTIAAIDDFAINVLITDNADFVRSYMEQIAPLSNREWVFATSYGALPFAMPYINTENVVGLLVGYKDSLIYNGQLNGGAIPVEAEQLQTNEPIQNPVDLTPTANVDELLQTATSLAQTATAQSPLQVPQLVGSATALVETSTALGQLSVDDLLSTATAQSAFGSIMLTVTAQSSLAVPVNTATTLPTALPTALPTNTATLVPPTSTATPIPPTALPSFTPTNRPRPTNTPTFTPSPEPTILVGTIIAPRTVNVRENPSSSASTAVIASLRNGDVVRVLEVNADGSWVSVILPDNRIGWVAGFLIQVEEKRASEFNPSPKIPALSYLAAKRRDDFALFQQATATPEPRILVGTIILDGPLDILDTPDLTGAVIGQANLNDVYRVLLIQGEWASIVLPDNRIGWIEVFTLDIAERPLSEFLATPTLGAQTAPTNTNTSVPATNTQRPPTSTPRPATNTPVSATNTLIPATNTARPATNTPIPATNTALPPTATNTDSATVTPSETATPEATATATLTPEPSATFTPIVSPTPTPIPLIIVEQIVDGGARWQAQTLGLRAAIAIIAGGNLFFLVRGLLRRRRKSA